jgi:hypothetical protein
MSTELESKLELEDDLTAEPEYRALSPAAVLALGLGLLSVLAFFDWVWALFPAVGLVTGIRAWRKIRNRPEELTGAPLAMIGLILSLLCWVGGWSLLAYQYATEVPPGYARISYEELQPDPKVTGEAIPRSALELDGKQVFIKGYVYPTEQKTGLKRFTLCRDQGTCCFGGNPKLTDRIQVSVADQRGVNFYSWQYRVAGTFRVRPASDPNGLAAIYYLEDAQVIH